MSLTLYKRSVERKLMVALCVALAAMLACSLLALEESRRYLELQGRLDRLSEFSHAIDRTLSGFLDSETGARGFVITGDDDYLAPYFAARNVIDERLNWLLRFSQNHPEVGDEVLELRRLARLKTDTMATKIIARRFRGFSAAQEAVRRNSGQAQMDAIRGVLGRLQSMQESERTETERGMQELIHQLLYLGIVTFAVVLVAFAAAVVLVFMEMRQRRRETFALERRANHDVLTGLPNRAAFFQHLQGGLAAARLKHEPLSVLFIDLDGFKAINDSLGHDAGDRALVEVARRLSGTVRSADIVARVGGDEFAATVMGSKSAADARILASRIAAAISRPIPGSHLPLGASVGIANFPEHGEDAEALMAYADQMMYEIKRNRRSARA